MRLFLWLLVFLLLVVGVGLVVWTRAQVSRILAEHPPTGVISNAAGGSLHYRHVKAADGSKVPILFIHGASGNLLDPFHAFQPVLEGKRELLFVDRPGHGFSPRLTSETPALQAARYVQLLDALKIKQVVLVGHSLGSASVAAFAVLYPDRVKGLVFLAPATHPWPTGVDWYYDLGSTPLVARLFTEALTLPVGMLRIESGARGVFAPNPAPADYAQKTAVKLVLRPETFRANARDVAGLNAFVEEFSKRYNEITAPTVVITGDKDDVVAPSIHSVGLERDIKGAELIVLPGVGHKPDYVATQTVLEAIEKVSG
ncbi:MAG: alpha/beta hydrolase [Pseudomonadota bacterium]